MSTVTFDQVSIQYPGAERPSVAGLNLEIADGELLVLVGPSGCGKSTTLRALAGLEPISQGTIRIGEEDVSEKEPRERDIAMVFQNYALYPHMTVAENMGFALKLAKKPKAEIAERVAEAAKLLDLQDFLGRKPKELSGGQRQRVAMGRAIVRQPKVFLMDEPLSNLDAKLRVQTRTQIADLQRRLGTTTVYVTHDQVEAMTMGDRVAVLNQGVLQQVAAPRELYQRPANAFVAGFIGSPAMNLVPATVGNGTLELGGTTLTVAPEALGQAQPGTPVLAGVRPEDFEVLGTVGDVQPSADSFVLDVRVVEELGSDAYVYGTTPSGVPTTSGHWVVRADWRTPPERNQQLVVRPDVKALHLFANDDEGLRLN